MGTRNRNYERKHDQRLRDVKVMLCQKLITAVWQEQKPPEAIAAKLGTSRSTISLIQQERVDRLTFNQLFLFLVILRPNFEILVSIRRNE
jgi:hypothetical protein